MKRKRSFLSSLNYWLGFSLFGINLAAEEIEINSSPLPFTEGLILDLNANQGVVLEDGNRVKAWHNQVSDNSIDVFVKQDEGRKIAGSGRPTLKKDIAAIGGHHTLVFEDRSLHRHPPQAFHRPATPLPPPQPQAYRRATA